MRFLLIAWLAFSGCKCRSASETAEVDAGSRQVGTGRRAEVKVGALVTQLDVEASRPQALGSPFPGPISLSVKPDEVKLQPRADPAFRYFAQLASSKTVGETLAAQGLAVDANRAYDEFFQLYEQNRYRPLLIESGEKVVDDEPLFTRRFLVSVPSVVTSDVLLHNLHLFFDYALATAETQKLSPAIAAVLDAAFTQTLAQREALAGTPWAEAAADNLVFLDVARVLLRADQVLPDPDRKPEVPDSSLLGVDTASQTAALLEGLRASLDQRLDQRLDAPSRLRAKVELGRILDAQETAPLTLFAPPEHFKEVYSQYVPRGHYVKSPALTSYFLAVMWLSRVPLHLSSEPAVRSAVLLTLATSRPEVAAQWLAVHDTLAFLVGPPDDVTFADFSPVLAHVARQGPLSDEAVFQQLTKELADLAPPRVQSVRTEQEAGPALATQRAFHFFSQRAVIDAVLLQGLVDPQVPGKNFVRALEVPEVFGSQVAGAALAPEKLAEQFAAWQPRRDALATSLGVELQSRQGREFTAGWLAALQPLLEGKARRGPRFMQTGAFATLRLSTWLANYAELKHDTVLYAKQGAAEMGGPGFEDTEETIDDRGYVVPEIDVYARVGFLLANLRTGLRQRGLFPEGLAEAWVRFEKLTAALETISRKELEGKPLTTEEYHLIKFIGGDLEHFWEETLIVHPEMERWMLLRDNNTRIIADLFTGPAGITHVASGWVHPVYLAFPRDGKIAIGRGAVLSFYEVTSKERLTDQSWRTKLGEERPPLPAWTQPVFVQDLGKELSTYDELSQE